MTNQAPMAAAYISERAVAEMLNHSPDWLRKHRADLEADGFPKRDRLIGFTLLDDVRAWIYRRRVVADIGAVDHHQPPDSDGVNYDLL